MLLEARVHRFSARDNDKIIKAAIERGIEAMRAGEARAATVEAPVERRGASA